MGFPSLLPLDAFKALPQHVGLHDRSMTVRSRVFPLPPFADAIPTHHSQKGLPKASHVAWREAHWPGSLATWVLVLTLLLIH